MIPTNRKPSPKPPEQILQTIIEKWFSTWLEEILIDLTCRSSAFNMKANDQNSKSNTKTRTEGQASMQRLIRSAHELEDKGLETRIRGLDCWNV